MSVNGMQVKLGDDTEIIPRIQVDQAAGTPLANRVSEISGFKNIY